MALGVGVAEPKIGVGVGEPHKAPAAAVVDGGDKGCRLSGAGGRAGLDRRRVRIGPGGGRYAEVHAKDERGKDRGKREIREFHDLLPFDAFKGRIALEA